MTSINSKIGSVFISTNSKHSIDIFNVFNQNIIMKTKKCYPIKYVAAQTGIKAHNIRSWEERYGAVKPERSATNRRLYSDDDIQRLRLLKAAVDGGHNISTVANLDANDLLPIIGRNAPVPNVTVSQDTAAASSTQAQSRTSVELALSYVVQLDAAGLESVLSETAVTLPRQAFVQEVIVPLFSEIGALWHAGRLKIINEHMASVIVRSILWDMLRTFELSDSAPRILIATPAGHWHECGALASALVAAESGWQPFYFGPNLPSEEIVYATKKIQAAALALSLSHRLNHHKLVLELKKIRRMVDENIAIFIGGAGIDAQKLDDEALKETIVNDLIEFRERIEKLG